MPRQIRSRSACIGPGKLDHVLHAARERLVDVAPEVGGEDDDAVVLLELLQEIGDLDVGVAIVRVLDLAALAEERLGLVEEERWRCAARAARKMRSRFFSVSPMYLLTTPERSIL